MHCASAFGPPYTQVENKNPMVVVGNTNEALAAAMSLCARDVLSNNSQKLEERRSPIPPAQPIAFFNKQTPDQASDRQHQRLPSETVSSLQNALLFLGPSMDDDEHILANALQSLSRISDRDPMLHTSIDFGCKEGSKTMQSLSITRDRFSFLGLSLKTDLSTPGDNGRFLLSRESADELGNQLHTLLDGFQSSAAVTTDIRTHLAMLQANSLPRSRGVLGGEKDIWAISDTPLDGMRGDGMLLEYQFDYTNPFGGSDPLSCPSTGSIIPSPTSSCYSSDTSEANDAYAAAYSAMVGSGMDFLQGICIATSVKAIFRELGEIDGDGIFCPPSYTWSVIDQIAECSLKARQNIRQEDGLSRKMYKEFGYR